MKDTHTMDRIERWDDGHIGVASTPTNPCTRCDAQFPHTITECAQRTIKNMTKQVEWGPEDTIPPGVKAIADDQDRIYSRHSLDTHRWQLRDTLTESELYALTSTVREVTLREWEPTDKPYRVDTAYEHVIQNVIPVLTEAGTALRDVQNAAGQRVTAPITRLVRSKAEQCEAAITALESLVGDSK